jgi:hypothetical protein
MLGFSRRKKIKVPPVLYFKDTSAAFEYACEWMAREVRPRQATDRSASPEDLIVGFVHGPAAVELGPSPPGRLPPRYDVSLAVKGGRARVPQCGSILVETAFDLLDVKVEPPRAGDLVLVDVGAYNPDYPFNNLINYFMITFRLKPEMETKSFAFRSELEELARKG